MKRFLPACLLACALSGAAETGTVFDFRNDPALCAALAGQSGPVSFINNGIVATFTASDGIMNRTASGFGLNSTIPGDDTDAFDVGEWINITFGSIVTLTNVSVSSWSAANGDAATLYVDGTNSAAITNAGNHALSIRVAAGKVLRISCTAGTVGNGWSLDGITVQELSSIPSNIPPVLDPLGDKTVLEGLSLSFAVTASDPMDHDPVILSATHLPAGAVFTNGVFIWSNAVPAGNYAVTFCATDKDGSDSETLTITVAPRPQLFISEIADPDGIGGDGYRFVELYNAGTNALNLASNRWHLCRQNNGADWSDIPLTGTVSAAGTYVIAKNRSDFNDAYGFYPQQESSGVDGNGNDAYFLYYGGNHTNGTLIDLYGQTDTTGTGAAWEYTDGRAARNNSVLQPNDVWRASEWMITSAAAASTMTPGMHGPVPEFQGLENPFVFLGDSLRLTVTAVNTVRTDVIRLSAAALPAGATFATTTGVHAVSSTLNWNSPTTGVYTATFAAAGLAGTNTASVTITVSSGSQIAGKFYGWSGDTIFKLVNGQFWQQSVSGSKTVSPALYRPYITITNYLSYQRRMYVTNVTGYAAVVPLAVTESAVTNTFAGLHYQNIYQLADGTIWKQISSEIISSNASSITAWRWTKDGQQKIRFLDRNDIVVGTCTVEAFVPPADTKIHSTVAGYFYGFGYGTIFRLANGSWWKQISFERSTSIRRNPEVLVWNERGTDYLEMPDEGLQVSAEKLIVQTESTITNAFAGLHYGNTYRLADGSDWLQLGFENISTNVSRPNVMLWADDTQTNLLVRDSQDATIGTCLVADLIGDSDNDGQSNAAEVLAGFDPLDSQSRFELRQTDRYVLSWIAVTGRVYTIEWSPSLTERFQTLETSVVWPQNSWTDTVHAVETRGFYRIGVRLAE